MQTQIIDTAVSAGIAKCSRTTTRVITLAAMAGAFISLGGILSVYAGSGVPGIAAENPGIAKILSGLTFPIGLFLVVLFGAELFTGNNAVLIPALARKHYGMAALLRNWSLVWVGNFIGALVFTFFMVAVTGLVDIEPYNSAIIRIATTKAEMSPLVVFFRGIGANWCVCLAVWLALAGKNMVEKTIGCWIPVFAFVALGFEHCIANMFFIPCGMMAGADISLLDMSRNLLFSTLGNIVGGAVFVGALYDRLYGKRSK